MAGDKEIELFRAIALSLYENADVYIMACKTGFATNLLQQVRGPWRIRVHGYTEYITTTNYWFTSPSMTERRRGAGIICLPGNCYPKFKPPTIKLSSVSSSVIEQMKKPRRSHAPRFFSLSGAFVSQSKSPVAQRASSYPRRLLFMPEID